MRLRPVEILVEDGRVEGHATEADFEPQIAGAAPKLRPCGTAEFQRTGVFADLQPLEARRPRQPQQIRERRGARGIAQQIAKDVGGSANRNLHTVNLENACARAWPPRAPQPQG